MEGVGAHFWIVCHRHSSAQNILVLGKTNNLQESSLAQAFKFS